MRLLILAALAKYNSSIYNRSYEQDEKVSTASSYRTNSLNYCWSLNIVYNINDDKFGIEDINLGGSDIINPLPSFIGVGEGKGSGLSSINELCHDAVKYIM